MESSSKEALGNILVPSLDLEMVRENPLLLDEAMLDSLEQSDPRLARELVDKFMYVTLGRYGLEDAEA